MKRAELEQYAGRTIPDLVPDDLRLLFVGINPGLVSAATGLHFARRGNRFYPALQRAGIITVAEAADAQEQLLAHGIGITNLVARASARADELDDDEVVAGRERLASFVERHRPRVVALLGITSYRIAFGDRRAKAGRQEDWSTSERFTVQRWVAPNPSGLNAHATLESLAADYGEIADAAGVVRAG